MSYVEEQLSTPNRQIRINGIQGVLSSNASIAEITIADRQGVWLRITNARIVWTRRALFLGRLDIETLAADRIDVLRKPVPEEGLPPPEAGSLQIPELPLAVNIGALDVPLVTSRRRCVRPCLANQAPRWQSPSRPTNFEPDIALDAAAAGRPGRANGARRRPYAKETDLLALALTSNGTCGRHRCRPSLH